MVSVFWIVFKNRWHCIGRWIIENEQEFNVGNIGLNIA